MNTRVSARMAEVADALGYGLAGYLQPIHSPMPMWRSASSSSSANITFETASYRLFNQPIIMPANLVQEVAFGIHPLMYTNIPDFTYSISGRVPKCNFLFHRLLVPAGVAMCSTPPPQSLIQPTGAES